MAEAYSSGPWSVHNEDSVDSTQQWARRRIASLPDRTAVLARSQTGGRGRAGKTWLSPPGGFYCSLLLKPAPPIQFAPSVSLLAAFCLSEIMRDSGIPAMVKWPNDVVAEELKLAGMIAETGSVPSSWFILGIGVNLLSEPFIEGRSILPPGAWSRFCEPPSPGKLLQRLLSELDSHWPARTGSPLGSVCGLVTPRLWNLGKRVSVKSDGIGVDGVVDGIDENGFLLLSTDSGERRFVSGELLTVHGERVQK
ncbi:MAG TPA: biotin--[acetyl-CoA-carboxylase] ligase [Candidatus Sabulitectum sp.]|nr:biotin--[acetyl-CoA-carboxylase] ligase [Candidatus Sabulitectum sp.]